MTAKLQQSTIDKLNHLLRPEASWQQICGYIVTTGTGDGTFAYRPEDVEAWAAREDVDHSSYQDFCDVLEPISDRATALAIWVATAEMIKIDEAGRCTPVIVFTRAHEAGRDDAERMAWENDWTPEDAEQILEGGPPHEDLINSLDSQDLADHFDLDPEDLREEDDSWSEGAIKAFNAYDEAYLAALRDLAQGRP